jgi:hypothetical protein
MDNIMEIVYEKNMKEYGNLAKRFDSVKIYDDCK